MVIILTFCVIVREIKIVIISITFIILFIFYLKAFHIKVKSIYKIIRFKLIRTNSYLEKPMLNVSNVIDNDEDLRRIFHLVYENGEAELAIIDQDGYYYPLYNVKNISSLKLKENHQFLKRKKYNLSLVVLDGGILAVKKKFGKENIAFFANELIVLSTLQNRCMVPRIIKTDINNCILYMSYINGITVRSMLASQGAMILDVHYLSKNEQNSRNEWIKRVLEGKKYLSTCIDQRTIDMIYKTIKQIHNLGVCVYDIKYGNIMIEKSTNDVYFIDFENSILFSCHKGFIYKKAIEFDLELLDFHFKL
ncbi:hypothetical protein JCM14469_43120 [Desulfatiferula olefinivorans]